MDAATGPVEIDAAALIEALDEGVLVHEEGRVCVANRALARMSGLAPAELAGRPLAELFTDSDGAPLGVLVSSNAVRLRDSAGELVPVSLRRVNERTAVVVDRSRERRLEHEVWRLTAPGAGASPAGELLASEIAGMIEHEVGTASTLVRGYLRMLLDGRAGPLTDEQRGFLLEARRGTERIGRLAADLLEVAAADRPGELTLVRKPQRLGALIEAALAGSRPLLEERRIQVELELDLERDELRVDPLRIEQVIANLLSNAAKFAPEQSTVRVAAHDFEQDAGASVCVSVIDEGPGIDADEAERIFEPFVRGASAESSGASGVGLGLAVCRAIAAAHGGRVEALSSLGHGHFRLVLPLDPQE